jgi:hypothetical protein
MSSNAQVSTLMAALTAVQADVSGLLDKANSLTQQLQSQQDAVNQQPAAAASEPVDLSQAIQLAQSIRDTLEGTVSDVQDHVDTAQASSGSADQTTGSVDQSGGATVDNTTAEQTVIGEGGQPVDTGSTGTGGSSGQDASQQGVDTGGSGQ